MNQDLLYLALDEQKRLKRYRGFNVYDITENFKEKRKIIFKHCVKNV